MRDPGFIPTGGNIFHWIFLFSYSKLSDANICNIVNFVQFVKTPLASAVVVSWSLTQEMAGWQVQFTVMTNIFFAEFTEFREKIQGKLNCTLASRLKIRKHQEKYMKYHINNCSIRLKLTQHVNFKNNEKYLVFLLVKSGEILEFCQCGKNGNPGNKPFNCN